MATNKEAYEVLKTYIHEVTAEDFDLMSNSSCTSKHVEEYEGVIGIREAAQIGDLYQGSTIICLPNLGDIDDYWDDRDYFDDLEFEKWNKKTDEEKEKFRDDAIPNSSLWRHFKESAEYEEDFEEWIETEEYRNLDEEMRIQQIQIYADNWMYNAIDELDKWYNGIKEEGKEDEEFDPDEEFMYYIKYQN